MPFKDAKIYNDGSHYIAILKTTRPKRPIVSKTTLKKEFDIKYAESISKKKRNLKK